MRKAGSGTQQVAEETARGQLGWEWEDSVVQGGLMWGWSIGWACLMGHWAEDGKEGEGAKVVGMEKKGWAGRGRIVRTWGLTGCAGCRLSGIIPGFCEGGVGAESGRSGKRRCFRGQHQNEISRGYPGEVLRRQLVTQN